MNVLVVDRDPTSLVQTVASVRELNHKPAVAKSESDVRVQPVPDIAIVNLGELGAETGPIIRYLRTLRDNPPLYIIGLTGTASEAQVNLAYEAGLDLDMRNAANTASLAARLRPVDRLPRKIDSRNPNHSSANAATVDRVLAVSPAELIARTTGWKTMTGEIQRAMSTFLTIKVGIGPGDPTDGEQSLVRGIVLSNTGSQLEMRVVVATDPASAKSLAVHLFGDSSPELDADMIGEITNITMGTLKSSFSHDSISFTGGLPEALPVDRFYQFGATCTKLETFSLVVEGARLFFRVGIASKQNQFIEVGNLREGMVLAKDVYSPRGMLLLCAGTRLSTTAADRLRQTLVPKQTIEVATG